MARTPHPSSHQTRPPPGHPAGRRAGWWPLHLGMAIANAAAIVTSASTLATLPRTAGRAGDDRTPARARVAVRPSTPPPARDRPRHPTRFSGYTQIATRSPRHRLGSSLEPAGSPAHGMQRGVGRRPRGDLGGLMGSD